MKNGIGIFLLGLFFSCSAWAGEGVRVIPLVEAGRVRAEITLHNPGRRDLFCSELGAKLQLRSRQFGEPVGSPQLEYQNLYIEAGKKRAVTVDLADLGLNGSDTVIHDIAITTVSCGEPSFKDYCKFATHTSEDAFTIDKILRENNARRCDDFNKEGQTRAAYRGDGIVSARPFGFLGNLKRLDLSQNKIMDPSPLANLKNLEVLRLASNPAKEVGALESLKVLEELDISSTAVQDISPLVSLPRLSVLDIRHSSVFKLEPLVRMPALRQACLEGTRVVDYKSHQKRLDELNSNCAW
jgi:hypothetical protein